MEFYHYSNNQYLSLLEQLGVNITEIPHNDLFEVFYELKKETENTITQYINEYLMMLLYKQYKDNIEYKRKYGFIIVYLDKKLNELDGLIIKENENITQDYIINTVFRDSNSLVSVDKVELYEQVEYDTHYYGGEYTDVGHYAVIPAGFIELIGDKALAFEVYTGIGREHIVSLMMDDGYVDENGEDLPDIYSFQK